MLHSTRAPERIKQVGDNPETPKHQLTRYRCPSRKLITDIIIEPPAAHNDDAGHRLLDIVLPSQTLAATPTHDSGLFIRFCRVDQHVAASAACCMFPSKSGRGCWATRTATSRRTTRRLSWTILLKQQIAPAEKSSATPPAPRTAQNQTLTAGLIPPTSPRRRRLTPGRVGGR